MNIFWNYFLNIIKYRKTDTWDFLIDIIFYNLINIVKKNPFFFHTFRHLNLSLDRIGDKQNTIELLLIHSETAWNKILNKLSANSALVLKTRQKLANKNLKLNWSYIKGRCSRIITNGLWTHSSISGAQLKTFVFRPTTTLSQSSDGVY